MKHFTVLRTGRDRTVYRYMGWYYDVQAAQREAEIDFAAVSGHTPAAAAWRSAIRGGEPMWSLSHRDVEWIVQQEDSPILGGPPDPDMVALFVHADGTTHTWEAFQNPPPYQWSVRTHPSLDAGGRDFRLARFDQDAKRAWYEEVASRRVP
jgi:hypothetical protein